MKDIHIKEAVKKLDFIFARCAKMSGYKAVMYLENEDGLKRMIKEIIPLVEKQYSHEIEKSYDLKGCYTVYFNNGSHFAFTNVGDITVIGERTHVLFVDSKIRGHELRSLAPVIAVYMAEDGSEILNPKPIYLNLE